ncbi:MAG: preprotein translocase subunit SecE [Patescibacteria group bacterium]
MKESRAELLKVTWPARQTTVRYTLIVIGASLVVGFVIGGLDFAFTKALETFLF